MRNELKKITSQIEELEIELTMREVKGQPTKTTQGKIDRLERKYQKVSNKIIKDDYTLALELGLLDE